MAHIAVPFIALWFMGAMLVALALAESVFLDPNSMPGGGWRSIAILAISWPILIVACVASIMVQAVSAVVTSGSRGRL